MTIDEKKHEQGSSKKQSSIFTQSHIGEMMSELELSISKLVVEMKDDNQGMMGAMRDHIIEVYQKVGYSLLKRQIYYDELLSK